MQADLFKCSLCSESYDLELHTPKILISCPHCFCLTCLENIFINHPPKERQCPTCSLSFFSTINCPEDFPTDPTLIYLLQSPPQTNIGNYTEPDFQPQRNKNKDLFQGDVRKKLKKYQEIDDKQEDLRELVISQFIGMRKILQSPQNIESPLKAGTETLPNTDSEKKIISGNTTAEKSHDETESVIIEEGSPENRLAEIANKLQGIFDETQEAIDRLSKKNERVASQIPQENSIFRRLSSESENEDKEVKIKALSSPKANISEKLQDSDSDEENYLALKPKITNKVTETGNDIEKEFAEEEELQSKEVENTKLIEQEIQETPQENPIFSRLFSENEDEEGKIKPLSPLNANISEEFQDSDDENYLTLKPKMMNKVTETGDGIEEEFDYEEEEKSLTKESEKEKLKTMKNNEIEVCDEMEQEFAEEEEEEQAIPQQIMEIEAEPKLKLDFSEEDLSSEMFSNFCTESFWKTTLEKKICHLEVNFSSSFLTDEIFAGFVQYCLTKMETLTTLVMNLAHTKISQESLQTLSGQCLKKNKLKSFILDCSGLSIGDEGLKSLDDGLNFSFKTLEKIELIFDSTDIQGEEFLNSLFGMSQLKHLRLSFEGSQISSEIVSSIASCLHSIGNLENLKLNFNNTGIGDESLSNFSISHLTGLKHFKLYLGGTFISNDFLLDSFQKLGSSLLATGLESLELDLHCTEFSNTALKVFCESGLSQMQNLKGLKLNLRQTKITDEGLKNLRLLAHKPQFLALNVSEKENCSTDLQTFEENDKLINIKNIDFHDKANQDVLNQAEKECSTKAFPPENGSSVENSEDPQNHLEPKNESKLGQEESEQKRKVYKELKRELILRSGSKRQDPSKMDTTETSRLIEKLEPKVYDNILIKILARVLQISNVVPDIEEWKKIIQAMINTRFKEASHKPEKKIRKKSNHRSNGGKQKKSTTQRKQEDDADDANDADDENPPCQVFSQNDPMKDEQLSDF